MVSCTVHKGVIISCYGCQGSGAVSNDETVRRLGEAVTVEWME